MDEHLSRLEPERPTQTRVVESIAWVQGRRGARFELAATHDDFHTLVFSEAATVGHRERRDTQLSLTIAELLDVDSLCLAWRTMRFDLAAIVGYGLATRYYGELPLYYAASGRAARRVRRIDPDFEGLDSRLHGLEVRPAVQPLGAFCAAYELVTPMPVERHALIARSPTLWALCTRGTLVVTRRVPRVLAGWRYAMEWIRRGCTEIRRPSFAGEAAILDRNTVCVIEAAAGTTRN